MPTTAFEAMRQAAQQVPVYAPRELSLMRVVAQGLVPATSSPTPAEAVRRHLAVQGQQVSAVPHAILSRTQSAAGMAEVEDAFETGQLVRSWPMRGTIHVTTGQDHHWLRTAIMHRGQAWNLRTERELGIDEAFLDRAAQVALDGLAEHGPLPRATLMGLWQGAGLVGAHEAKDVSSYRRRHLLVRLQREGVLVQGPRRGNEHLVVSALDLPPASTGPGGAGGGARGTDGHRAALAEIARRYATSHGPVSVADLARWTALAPSDCRQGLEDALETTAAAAYETDPVSGRVALVRMVAEGGLRGRVRVLGDGESMSRAGTGSQVLYGRADLPDLLETSRREAQGTFFLASFDELHVGYKDRLCLSDASGELLICPSMNGMFRPLVVDRGRLVAVRPAGKDLEWAVEARRSARLERDVQRAVRRVEERLGR